MDKTRGRRIMADALTLDKMPPEWRKELPFDDPALDAHAAQVEAQHGLPTGILRALKNHGERSHPGAVSPAGARGVMQFMPETGKRYGLSDFQDPLESINAAGMYVKDIIKTIGSSRPDLIAAAYNAGENRPELKAGRVPNFPETQAYAVRVNNAMRAMPQVAPPEVASTLDAEFTKPNVPRETINPGITPSPAPTGSFYENAMAGAGKYVVDTGRGFRQLYAKAADLVSPRQQTLTGVVTGKDNSRSDEIQSEIDQAAARDKPLMGTAGGVIGNIGGAIATALLPGAGLKGAGGMLAKIPQAAGLASKLVTAGNVLNAPASLKAAAGVGAGLGALQPVTTDNGDYGRLINSALGGAGGAGGLLAGRLIGSAISGGKALLDPFHAKGQNLIQGRALNAAAGDQAGTIAKRLEQAAQPAVGPFKPGMEKTVLGEIVPGAAPTVGQAARDPAIASLERAAVATNPGVGRAHTERIASQNAAIRSQFDDMAGTGGRRAFFESARETAADQLYKDAYRQGVDLTRDAATGQFLSKQSVSARKGEITKLMQTPALQQARKEAITMMRNDPNLKGQVLSPDGSVQGLHYVRRALKDKIDDATGDNKRILTSLLNRFDATLDTISPKYAQARVTFREMSKPINEMDTVAEISAKAIDPLTGNIQPSALARNLTDKAAARGTGFRGSTLDNTLTSPTRSRLDNILEHARMASEASRSKVSGSDTVQKLAYTNMLDQAGVPTFIRRATPFNVTGNVLSRAADSAYGRANREIGTKLGEAMLDPGLAARLMRQAAVAQQPGRFSTAITPLLPATGAGIAIGGRNQ